MSKRIAILAAALVGLSACAQRDAEYQAAVDTLTRAQKDSLIATMPIPGAGGVGRAIDAARDANARAQAHDTIR